MALATCQLLSSWTEAALSLSADPVCSKPASFYKLFAGLNSTNKSVTSFLFFSSLTHALFLPHCILLHLFFYLNLFGRSGWNCVLFPPALSGYNGSLDTRFCRGTARPIRRPHGCALLVPSEIPCSLSPHIFCIHSSLFLGWMLTVSSKLFDTQVPSISTEELVLSRHARSVLSRLRWNGHSLLLNCYLSKISRIENPSCSVCGHASQDPYFILHCPAADS